MDYTIVTAWYDVRTKENHELKNKSTDDFFCTTNTYFEKAKLLFDKPFPLVIFTEPRFKSEILALRPAELHPITRIICKDYDELPFYSYFKRFEENHVKYPVINLDKTKFTPLYKFVVAQKTNFVKDVVEMNPFNTTRFAWMDLRLHDVYNMPVEETTQVMTDILPGRVKMMFMTWLHSNEIYDRHDFYIWTRGKVAAGFFGGEREPLLNFAQLCQKEFIEAINWDMCPSDEMIYSWIVHAHPDLFDPYVGEYRDCLNNQLEARSSLHLYIPFLIVATQYKNHQYVIRLTSSLRTGHLSGKIKLPPHDIATVWYNAYISNFELQRPDDCLVVIKEYIQLAAGATEIAEHFRKHVPELLEKSAQMGHLDLGMESI